MILHYAGKYDGNEDSLPSKEHHPNAVPFKEVDDMKKFSLIANIGSIGVMLLLAIPFLIMGLKFIPSNVILVMFGGILGGLSLFPHELLHAICYKKDVYLYQDLEHGLMFVVGTEDMSKWHFIFMCLCPNIVLGLIPYIVFLICPKLVGLGLFGIICIGTGFGDWINVYNAMKQMPKNAKTYLCGMHSYWYV
ncbi:MAG: DUF3267 domain-containing protein [Lachnospiraceae bacterium]|nr:DUF3267 domain-containing protein [Lachnospiraceae bacterium]